MSEQFCCSRDAEGASRSVLATEPQQHRDADTLDIATVEPLAPPLGVGREGTSDNIIDSKDKACEDNTPICKPVTVDTLRPHSDVVVVLQVHKAAWRNCQVRIRR